MRKTAWGLKFEKNLYDQKYVFKMQERANPIVSLTFPLSLLSFSVTRWPSAPFSFHFSLTPLHPSSFFIYLFPFLFHLFALLPHISSALFIVWRPLRSPLMLFCALRVRFFVRFHTSCAILTISIQMPSLRSDWDDTKISFASRTMFIFIHISFPYWFITNSCALQYIYFFLCTSSQHFLRHNLIYIHFLSLLTFSFSYTLLNTC